MVICARCRNTGQKLSASEDTILEPGKAPICMEPVRATIAVRRAGQAKVILLDHDGRATQRTLDARNGTFTLDGARDKTPYYAVQY